MKFLSFLNLKKFIIDKEFQYSFIIRNLIMLVLIVVSMLLVVIVWNQHRFYQGFLVSLPSNEEMADWAVKNNVKTDSIEFVSQCIGLAKPYSFFQILFYPVLVIFLFNLVVITINSIYISYKISVPLHALKMAIKKKLEDGSLGEPLKLKEGEFFHELTSLVNLALFMSVKQGAKENK